MAVLRRRQAPAGCLPPLRRRPRSLETQETLGAVLRRRREPVGCLPPLPALLALPLALLLASAT